MALTQTTEPEQFGLEPAQRTTAFARWVAENWLLLLLGLLLLLLPAVAGEFVLTQIVGWSLDLGLIALSLMFLAGYGGMVSLVQMTVASVAGYTLTILGASSITAISLFWPWWVAAPLAIAVAVLFGAFAGILSARTEGIYTIMITLAIAAAFFYLTLQNYAIFNGFNGFTRIPAPKFWGIDWNEAVPLYYLILFFAAVGYLVVFYISRAAFGLALQGVRDNPRRMEAIGYNVTAHRVAAYAFAALIAGVGGILMVWLNHQISPGTAGIQATIYLLVVAVVGGVSHPIGAFVGAFIFVLLRTFALDALIAVGLDGRRFQLLIGIGFLIIMLFSPDGVVGLWRRWAARVRGNGNGERNVS
jgi:branched-chain amino acid transport system permease protein